MGCHRLAIVMPVGGAVVLLACAALGACASRGGVHVNEAPSGAPSGGVVPLELVRGMPAVELYAQGRTLRMIIDSGGTDQLAVTESALAGLDVTITGHGRFVSDAFGNIRRSRTFTLAESRLGDVHLRDLTGYEVHDGRTVIPGAAGEEPIQFDGYVGLDLLNQFNVLLDYPNNRLVLVAHDAEPPVDVGGWGATPFELGRFGIRSRMVVGGRRMVAVWDTGANHTVIRSDRVPRSDPPWPKWPYNETQDAVTAGNLAIGGVDLGPFDLVLMDFRQPNADLIVGTNLFESRAVWFDFAQRRLAVEPVQGRPGAP